MVRGQRNPRFSALELGLGIGTYRVGILTGTVGESSKCVQPSSRRMVARACGSFIKKRREAFLGMDVIALENHSSFKFLVFGALFSERTLSDPTFSEPQFSELVQRALKLGDVWKKR